MVAHKPQPQLRITTSYGGSSYTFTNDQYTYGQATRVENGFDTASFWLNDYQSCNWLAKMDAGSTFKIEAKDGSDAAWTEIFDGVIRFIKPRTSMQGEVIEVKCDGAGYGFEACLVSHEYGSESSAPTLDTMREILNTAITGIVDGHVNNIFHDHLTDSGYSYTSNNTTCEDIAGTIKYLYFPFVPASKALKDLTDMMQAIKGANAGPHWIVDVSNNLLVCTLGASHPDAANNGWYWYYGNSQANATLVQGVDILECEFEKLEKEANYILYHGACNVPTTGDWAENNAADWDDSTDDFTITNDNADFMVGAYSVKCATVRNDGGNPVILYPDTEDLSLNITALGGQYTPPTLNFYCKKNSEITNVGLRIDSAVVGGVAGGWILKNTLPMVDDEWCAFSYAVGPYYQRFEDIWDDHLTMSWTDVDSIHFWLTCAANDNNKYFWVDGLHFEGSTLRAAIDSTIDSTNKLKCKFITDDVAKGDTLVASDDSGGIARYAYAEYLRAVKPALVGWIQTPWLYNLLPGQCLHIHARKKADGTFNIDKDMRVLEVTHSFGPIEEGFKSTIQLTDDLTNSNPRKSFSDFNNVLRTHRQWEDRQASSIKAGRIDITQPILGKSY